MIMKKHVALIAASLATLTVGIARADDADRPLTREEVVAGVVAARQTGELAVLNTGGSWTDPKAAPAAAAPTREQVVAEVMAARQSGELAVLNSGGSWTPPKASPLAVAREKIISEFLAARARPSNALAMEQSL